MPPPKNGRVNLGRVNVVVVGAQAREGERQMRLLEFAVGAKLAARVRCRFVLRRAAGSEVS